MNLLLSHPDVCKPTGEAAQVFRGRREESTTRIIQRRLCYDILARILARQDLFDSHSTKKRRRLSEKASQFIDWVLHREKLRARETEQNRFKTKGVEYEDIEVEQARLLTKNVNGIVFMTDVFQEMYPDATFFGLVRNGLALCESHLRRGASVEEVGRLFDRVASRMLHYNRVMDNFQIVHFEELIRDPVEIIKGAYAFAHLDKHKVGKVRLQVKTKTSASGKRVLNAEKDRQLIWYDFDELGEYFDPEINDHQIARLRNRDREAFLSVAGGTMHRLGYA